MLGGGVFVTQNKILPGSYVNFVSTATTNSTLGERGVVAIPMALDKAPGTVIEITKAEFVSNCKELLGYEYGSSEMMPLREIFCNANKVYVYDVDSSNGTPEDVANALEAYEFNVLCFYADNDEFITAGIETVKNWRDEMGKKCQVVVYNKDKVDHEGVINVVSTVSDEGAVDYALTAWVAGAMAGCKVNESCTNKLYNGELTIVTDKTQAQLEDCIKNGQVAFHLVYGEVRMLEDINTLTTTTADKGEDFKSNQTIRVIDQIANDIAKLFNTKYLGKIPNNASGRVSLWADIVAHHRELEKLGAIEAFNATALTVEQGANKKSVVVNDVITVINSMAQLYMTVVVQ
jgi:hypothetical protein